MEDVWKRGYGDGVQLTWLFLALARAAGFEANGVWASDRNNYFFNPKLMDRRKLDENVVLVKLDGKDDSGNTVHWIIEGQNPVSMTQIGWSKNTFKPGDEVEIDAMLAKNGNPVGFLGSSSPTAPRRRIVINGKQFQP